MGEISIEMPEFSCRLHSRKLHGRSLVGIRSVLLDWTCSLGLMQPEAEISKLALWPEACSSDLGLAL